MTAHPTALTFAAMIQPRLLHNSDAFSPKQTQRVTVWLTALARNAHQSIKDQRQHLWLWHTWYSHSGNGTYDYKNQCLTGDSTGCVQLWHSGWVRFWHSWHGHGWQQLFDCNYQCSEGSPKNRPGACGCGTLDCHLDSDGIKDWNDFVAAVRMMKNGTVMYCKDECGGMGIWMST